MISRMFRLILPRSRSAEDWMQKGDVLLWEARLEDAFRCFERAAAKEPGNAAAWKQKGIALGMLGFFLEAADSFARAAFLDPSDKEAWMCRGFCLVRIFRYQEALSCFGQVLRLYPEEGYALYWHDLLKEEISQEGPGLGRTARWEREGTINSRG
jgi:tetratricopeptide (TPR) repeat protein